MRTTRRTQRATSQNGVASSSTPRTDAVPDRKRLLKRKIIENKNKNNNNNTSSSSDDDDGEVKGSTPLSMVVSECSKRWFQETLKEAKSGDVSMQVLVGQMYCNGYGVSQNINKANFWMTKASEVRSSVWKVSNKRPGYHASDSDSDESGNNC